MRLTENIIRQRLAALDLLTTGPVQLLTGPPATWARAIYANSITGTDNPTDLVRAYWNTDWTTLNSATGYEFTDTNAWYKLVAPDYGLYKPTGAGARRGMTNFALAYFYDHPDSNKTLLFGSGDPGPALDGMIDGMRFAYGNIVNLAPNQTELGDFVIEDTSGDVIGSRVGADIVTTAGNPWPIDLDKLPNINPDTSQIIVGCISIDAIQSFMPNFRTWDQSDSVLCAYARIKLTGLTIRTSHVDFSGAPRKVTSTPMGQISWYYETPPYIRWTGISWYKSETSGNVGWALIGRDKSSGAFKVFSQTLGTGVIADGEWHWIDIGGPVSIYHQLMRGDPVSGAVYDFYLVPTDPGGLFIGTLTDAQAGPEGLLRLWPAVSASGSADADGTPSAMSYSCETKRIDFGSIAISNLIVGRAKAQSCLIPRLPENPWPNMMA